MWILWSLWLPSVALADPASTALPLSLLGKGLRGPNSLAGDKAKGTYVIEGTRSPPDQHGVYGGNVLIDGVKKGDRSTFFPKDWTEKQVESAIEEAYRNRKPEVRSGSYQGETSTGMKLELRLDGKGRIESAYPIYTGPPYRGPHK